MVAITNQKEFPKAYTYMYWAKRGLDRKRGRKAPMPNSFYVKYTHHMLYGEETLPLFTHFDSAVQLAGYIKYVVLGEIVMGILSEEQVLDFFRNRTTLFSVADIDESLKQANIVDDADVIIHEWIKAIVQVCDTLALEKDEDEQKILLKRIEILFNNYFMGLEYRETYDLKIFFGMDEAKYDLLNHYKDHIRYQEFKALLYKSEWTWAETEKIKKILNDY